jgi:hypothetical protein
MKLEPSLNTLIQVLQKIYPDDDDFCDAFRSLKKYRFVENLRSLRQGTFVRFIDLRNDIKKISPGGFITESFRINPKISKSKYIRLRGINNRVFTINSDFNALFIRMDDDEVLARYKSLE